MTSRADILSRVRAAVAGSPSIEAPPRPTDPLDDLDAGQIRQRFVDRIVDYGAAIDEVDPTGVAAALARVVSESGIDSVLIPAGIPPDWLHDLAPETTTVLDRLDLAPGDLDRIAAVLTGCAVAIAETGTIVLDGGPGQGRRAGTLVPDRHICVVRLDQVVASVPQAVARLDPTAALTWISGGSATSDIELNRVEGVHGPRHLHVLLVG
jgi:L-lactate dehydrogenase complex protein LldG